MPDNLVHRGDTGATSNHGDDVVGVGLVLVLGDRTLEVEGVSGLELGDVGGHGAALVLLDEEVEEALIGDGGDGGVGTDDGLGALFLMLCEECG